MPLLVAGAVALGAFGFAVDKTGEGVDQASNGIVRVLIVGGVLYYIGKKAKVI